MSANSTDDSHEKDGSRPSSEVLLILAGGTICMRSSPDGYIPTKGLLGQCLAGHEAFDDGSRPMAREVIDENGVRRRGDASFRLPASSSLRTRDDGRAVRYTAFEFETLIDSSSADARYWHQIARCIARNYADFDGFVILHGTDTLAYAASALSFALHPLRKPVVLTGSQVSIFDEPNDAWDNILGSLTFAGGDAAASPEVCVFFHGKLMRGNRAVKIHASEYAAFASPNLAPLASLDNSWSERLIERSAGNGEDWKEKSVLVSGIPNEHQTESLDPVRETDSESVAVLRVYPGLQVGTLRALVGTPGLRGLILETFGAGNMPIGAEGKLLQTLSEAVDRGVIIVNVSQCLNGTVSPIYAPARTMERLGIVYGHDMTTEAAYAKLLFLLASPQLRPEEIRQSMAENLRGELTDLRPSIARTNDAVARKTRRESFVVTGLQQRAYVPKVVGRSASRER